MTVDVLGYYKILESDQSVDEKTLKIRYRDNAKLWHPDHNSAPDAVEKFQKISLAYNILSNPQTRLIYDLLCMVYSVQNFPDMKALKIYKSAGGNETPFLRVFKLTKVFPGLKNSRTEEQNLIGTFNDAEDFIKDITKHNWLKGWWGVKGVRFTKNALKNNYHNINANREDNFKMLVHNTAAFLSENKADKAYLSLLQALEYADENRAQAEYYLACLQPVYAQVPVWDYEFLKKIQLFIPKLLSAIIGCLVLIFGLWFFSGLSFSKLEEKIHYYQEVHYNNGSETVDDVVVSKVFNLPVDTSDTTKLFHITDVVNIMHGPSEKFDVVRKAKAQQTVRVTGYTPDKDWYRVMLDNGEMGFVKKEYLKAGIGKEIPSGSKIYQNSEK